jgi:hypothetical protein
MVKRQNQQVIMIICSLDDGCDRVIKPLRIRLEIEVARESSEEENHPQGIYGI